MRVLDNSFAASRDWVLAIGAVPPALMEQDAVDLLSNAALLHMVQDCGRISNDQRLRAFAARYFSFVPTPYFFGRLVDPESRFEKPPESLSPYLFDYHRWFLHAIAPQEYPLLAQDQANLFSAEKFRLGHLTHQLMALYFSRARNGGSLASDRLMSRLSERVAVEESFDFRVTDLYLQRIAVLLACGRSDLVKRRWVERAIAAQHADGGWSYSWHGWQPTPPYRFAFGPANLESASHSTVQGMWITCMLKYRYPEWIRQQYR